MRMDLLRFNSRKDDTSGLLMINNHFQCFTLEDEYREIKVPGETRISEGEYRVTLRTAGGMHQRYKKRFPDFYQGMLWIRDIDNFKYVYLHIGNDEGDTTGCPIVGTGLIERNGIKLLRGSKIAYVALYKEIIFYMNRGEGITIKISNIEA